MCIPHDLFWLHATTALRLPISVPFQRWSNFLSWLPVAVSPGDQLLHPEKKKTKAERDAEGDQMDSVHADRKHSTYRSVKLYVV